VNRRCNRWNNYQCNGGNCNACLWPAAPSILRLLTTLIALSAGIMIGAVML